MGMLALIGFAWVKWKSRNGLSDLGSATGADRKQEVLRVGVRGETYTYWYLRRQGYVFIAKNYEPAREKGEPDLVGFDGETLAFVEVMTHAVAKRKIALPELSIGREKHQMLVRTAHAFLREPYVKKCPVRFDVVAIDDTPGKPPVVRLIGMPLADGPDGDVFGAGLHDNSRYNTYQAWGAYREHPERIRLGETHCRSYARIQSQDVG